MADCIGCGYCCRKVPCAQAYHSNAVENGRCTALMWHEGRWACGLYVTAPNEEEKARIAKELYFGAGCCSNLNTYRRYNYIPTKKELEDETILLRVIEGNQ